MLLLGKNKQTWKIKKWYRGEIKKLYNMVLLAFF